MNPGARLGVLLRVAWRSLWSHRIKSLIVGSILGLGTVLLVVGNGLLDSVETAMQQSITQSLAGHLQVYDAHAKDSLALFGGASMGEDDYGEIPDFARVKQVIEAVPNVDGVVPMGLGMANMSRGSDLDRALADLRDAVRADDAAARDALVPKVRRMVEQLRKSVANDRAIAADTREIDEHLALLDRALSDAFWADFAGDPITALEFLDTRVAPIGGDGLLLYLRYLGTDLDAFAERFDRFRIVQGTRVPPGHRGLLINQKFADAQLKLKVARLLDEIHTARTINSERIAGNAALTAKARQAADLHGSISLQLDPKDAAALEGALRAGLPDVQGDLDALLKAMLTVDDANFDARYAFFYEHVAPRIELYPFQVGETVTVRTFTKRGYLKAVNVKVYGTFAFAGLERSELSGAVNLMDLMTFRDLYGQMTEAERAELHDIRAEVGAEQIDRDDAEAALFGDDSAPVAAAEASDFDAVAAVRANAGAAAPPATFTQDQLEHGLALNAAILLKDPEKLRETQAAIGEALKKAGLELNVVDWQQASGVVGQFMLLIRGVLWLAVLIIFIVAVVIINNSMLMATLERVKEIGTLRAIGAQRGFVMAMFIIETLALALGAGLVGAAAGAGILSWLGQAGIPATSDVMVFLFSGPRLHPTYELGHLVSGVVVILFVAVLSTLYPARLATRVQPVEAMRSSE